jgi:hypothetical protein
MEVNVARFSFELMNIFASLRQESDHLKRYIPIDQYRARIIIRIKSCM